MKKSLVLATLVAAVGLAACARARSGACCRPGSRPRRRARRGCRCRRFRSGRRRLGRCCRSRRRCQRGCRPGARRRAGRFRCQQVSASR